MQTVDSSDRGVRLEEAFTALARWGWEREWRGTDPYEGLNARRFSAAFRRSVTGKRVLTQLVKRSPLNLRPLLGIPEARSAVSMALVASAYARQPWLEEKSVARLREALAGLSALRCDGYDLPCWGYHFDVQTRVFFYPQGSPNTIATAFAGLALCDAYERLEDDRLLTEATGVAEFFVHHVPQTETDEGAFFGYLVGDSTPIHNANMLVAALLARVGQAAGRKDLLDLADSATRYTTTRQRADGSWPYGENLGLEWVDNFHTGYVLESLLTCHLAGIPDCEPSLERGLSFYGRELFLPDGTPKYLPDSVYPIDAQCAAQGMQTLALASSIDPAGAAIAWRTFDFTQAKLRRRDGAYRFQRRRFWSNGAPHMRWVAAPLLLSFATLGASTG